MRARWLGRSNLGTRLRGRGGGSRLFVPRGDGTGLAVRESSGRRERGVSKAISWKVRSGEETGMRLLHQSVWLCGGSL